MRCTCIVQSWHESLGDATSLTLSFLENGIQQFFKWWWQGRGGWGWEQSKYSRCVGQLTFYLRSRWWACMSPLIPSFFAYHLRCAGGGGDDDDGDNKKRQTTINDKQKTTINHKQWQTLTKDIQQQMTNDKQRQMTNNVKWQTTTNDKQRQTTNNDKQQTTANDKQKMKNNNAVSLHYWSIFT